MGYRIICGTRGFVFSLFGLVLLLPSGLRAAPTDYTQTATAYQTLLPLLLENFIGVLPDAGVDDNAFFYSPLVIGDDGGGGRGGTVRVGGNGNGSDGPVPPTNVLRRNPDVNTWSNNLMVLIDLAIDANGGLNPISLFSPMWGGPNYVGGFLSDPNNDPVGFGVFPLNSSLAGNGPFLQDVGTVFTLPGLDGATLPVASFPATGLNNFRPGQFPEFPLNLWHNSGPFPNVQDNPGFMVGGTAEADSATTIGNEIAIIFGAAVNPAGDGVAFVPIKVIHDFGAPQGRQAASGVNPLLADFNGDGCVDVAVLLDMTDSALDDLVYTLEGDCSGNFDNVTPVAHNLGPNDLVFDVAAYDADGDASSELVVTYTAPGSGGGSNAPNPGRVDIVFDPLQTFQVVGGPAIPSGMQPTFTLATDCDQENNADDLVVTGVEFFSPPVDIGDIPPLIPSDVLCFLDGGDESTVVYPQAKSSLNVASQPEGNIFPGIIIRSQVGAMGCGQGWTGLIFYILTDNNEGGDGDGDGDRETFDTRAGLVFGAGDGDGDGDGVDVGGITHILMAENSDCPGGGNGGGGGGGGVANGNFSGSGCLGSLSPQPGSPWDGLWVLALLLASAGLLKRRPATAYRNRKTYR